MYISMLQRLVCRAALLSATLIFVSASSTYAQSHGGGHGGGHSGGHVGGGHGGMGHVGGGHSGGGHIGGGGYMGGGYSGGSHHHHGGGFYGGYGGIGLGGIGYGYPYSFGGYGGSSLGYYGSYSAPRYYATPVYTNPAVNYGYSTYSRPYATVVPSTTIVNQPVAVQPQSNVYRGGVNEKGEPTGDIRPGMVLPDGAIVVSVGK